LLIPALACFLLAALASLVLTAVVRKLAPRIGLVDRPDGYRKLHRHPTPLGGGVAVFLATALVLAAVLVLPNPWGLVVHQDWRDVLGFGLASVIVLVVGLLDDRFGIRGRHKLLGQFAAAASMLLISDLIIEKVGLFGTDLRLGWFSIPVTLFWLVGATNSLNLLDGIDGLATILGIILGGTIAALAAMTGHPAVAFVALVFTGSLVGFLRFNFPPAKIFLGDAGSMLIGLLIGAMAIRASLKGPGTVLLAAALAVWTIPAFDTAVAILRRTLAGRSIYTTDRGHLHHRLLHSLGSSRRVLAVIAVCCTMTSAAALAGVSLQSDTVTLVSSLGIMALFVATGLFGRAELALLFSRARGFGVSLIRPFGLNGNGSHQSAVHLQGTRQWGPIWKALTDSAERLSLHKIRLDLNLPTMGEGYNATWENTHRAEPDECWRVEIPLVIDHQPAGRLAVIGHHQHASPREGIELLLSAIEPFENQLRQQFGLDDGPDAPSEQPELALAGGPPTATLQTASPRLPR